MRVLSSGKTVLRRSRRRRDSDGADSGGLTGVVVGMDTEYDAESGTCLLHLAIQMDFGFQQEIAITLFAEYLTEDFQWEKQEMADISFVPTPIETRTVSFGDGIYFQIPNAKEPGVLQSAVISACGLTWEGRIPNLYALSGSIDQSPSAGQLYLDWMNALFSACEQDSVLHFADGSSLQIGGGSATKVQENDVFTDEVLFGIPIELANLQSISVAGTDYPIPHEAGSPEDAGDIR